MLGCFECPATSYLGQRRSSRQGAAPESPARVEGERDADGGEQVRAHQVTIVGADSECGSRCRQPANRLLYVRVHLRAQLRLLSEQRSNFLQNQVYFLIM